MEKAWPGDGKLTTHIFKSVGNPAQFVTLEMQHAGVVLPDAQRKMLADHEARPFAGQHHRYPTNHNCMAVEPALHPSSRTIATPIRTPTTRLPPAAPSTQ